jgi:DNA-directed RNA polymerase sigma subunit (sigma70/sigma32)
VKTKDGQTADVGGLTYREIADRLGLSHARIQQIEARALAKMRKAAEKRGLRLEDVLGPRCPDFFVGGEGGASR